MTDREQKSIERIKMASEMALHNYKHPLVCTYSGGKDSDVMLELFKRSGVPFTVHNSHTTVDAPQTVRHIFDTFHRLECEGIKCDIDFHKYTENGRKKRVTMWSLIVKKMQPPTRVMRFCCSELKESSTKGLMIATGVRWAESKKRASYGVFESPGRKVSIRDEKMLLTDNDESRRMMERCQRKGEMIVNPILDWTDGEIWNFYRTECKHHNELYDMGYYRVGCIGCPMAGRNGRLREFADFPKYKDAYIRAFEKMLEARTARGLKNDIKWGGGAEGVFRWWMEDPNIEGQMTLDDFLQEVENG